MRKEKLEELRSYIEELRPNKFVQRFDNKNPFIKVESYYCHLNNGMVISRDKIIKGKTDNGSASIIMPVTKGGEVLVAIEPRVFTKLGVGVGFPAGYVEVGENIYEAALRELQEETGYSSDKIILMDSFYQDMGCSSAYNHALIAIDSVKVGETKFDESEFVRHMLFTYDELFELEEMGYIAGANSKIALAKSRKYMRGKL